MNLYIIQFGGTRPGTIFEAHEVRQAFGETIDEALLTLMEPVRAAMRAAHVDGYAEVALIAEDQQPGEDLFLVESGANGPGMFEQHAYDFIWAIDARAAQAAVRRLRAKWHIDTAMNISRAARAKGWSVQRCAEDGGPYLPLQKTRYLRI